MSDLRLELVDPVSLNDNPRNWRRHPALQQKALEEVLNDVGWAGALLFNERTGRLIDGHLRKEVAIKRGNKAVPVLVGSWSEEQEKKILLTLDPIAAAAEADEGLLKELMAEVDVGREMSQILSSLADDEQSFDDAGDGDEIDLPQEFLILVECRDEKQQTELLGEFLERGLECRALI